MKYRNIDTGEVISEEDLRHEYEMFNEDADVPFEDYLYDQLTLGRQKVSGLEEVTIWYAVMEDEDDECWGYGSENLEEAKRMCLDLGKPDAYIAVIDVVDDDPMCVGEIKQDEF